jgi:DNA-directed RNA polymerase subunit M/transcription elongation factor TFIIS
MANFDYVYIAIILVGGFIGGYIFQMGVIGVIIFGGGPALIYRIVKHLPKSESNKNICPNCGNPLPSMRIPSDKREAFWGGWTCPSCQTKLDRNLKEIENKQKISQNSISQTVSQPKQSQNARQLPTKEVNIVSEIRSQIARMLDNSSIFTIEQMFKLEDMVINSGENGVQSFKYCLDDVFSIRSDNFQNIWQPTLEIAKKTKNQVIYEFIEQVVKEGGDQKIGSIYPLSWAPSLRPEIIGGGEYGWSDRIWINVAKNGAEFLKNNLDLLPTEVREKHRIASLKACLHCLEIWENVLNGGKAVNPQYVEDEITYWKEMSNAFK